MKKFTPAEVAKHIEDELGSGDHRWGGHNIDPKKLADVAEAAMNPSALGTQRG